MRPKGFMEQFEWRRDATLKGKLTYLPIDGILPRLSDVIPGFTPSDYILITGASGSGKSRLTRFLFVKHVINMIIQYGINAKIMLNSTEETLEKIESTFVQSYLYRKFGINLGFYEIMHFRKPGQALSDEMTNKIREAWDHMNNVIRPYIDLSHEGNPYGFYKKVRNELANSGKFYNAEDKQVDVGDMFEYYLHDDPHRFVIAISDNLNNYSEEAGRNHEATLRYFSESYCRNILCLKANCIVVNVQQQVGDKERIDANFRGSNVAEKLYPSNGTLAHCTHTHRDATVVLGIHKPQKYHRIMPYYAGYEVAKNRNLTGLHILKTRESEPTIANIIPMNHLPGDIFEELPKI